MLNMTLGYYGAKLIASFEFPHGIQTRPERDALGIPTIMGMTSLPDGRKVTMDMSFTESEIVELYGERKKEFVDCVNRSVRVAINQHQFDALVAMAFNIGVSAFADEPNNTVLRLTNKEEFENAAAAFGRWVYGTLRGGEIGPDGKLARGPDGEIMQEGEVWKKAFGGLLRRQYSHGLLYMSLNWERAAHPNNIQLTKRTEERPFGFYDIVKFKTPWKKVKDDAKYDVLPLDEDDGLFDDDIKPITDPTPDTPLTTSDLNKMQLEQRKNPERPIDYGVPMTPLTKKVPIEAVEYLEPKDKEPGNITVKRIEDSKRGRGYAKSEMGKQGMIAGAGGSAAVAIGAAEPVVRFVDKYPSNTIAVVFLGLLLLGVGLHYYGRWERERGEDDAEDLLG